MFNFLEPYDFAYKFLKEMALILGFNLRYIVWFLGFRRGGGKNLHDLKKKSTKILGRNS